MHGDPEKLAELSEAAQNLLADYRAHWDEKLSARKGPVPDETMRDIFHSIYRLLKLPAPLVVSVDSPMQLMLMPALLRIRALADMSTWHMLRENLSLPGWKETVQALEERISRSDVSNLLLARDLPDTVMNDLRYMETNVRTYTIDSVFGRPKGKSIDSRLGFFESIISEIDSQLDRGVTPEIRDWVYANSFFADGGLPGRIEDLRNVDSAAEMMRTNQLRTAVQNLTNMGTTERAALRIFRERGDATSLLPDELVKQGEMELRFLEQVGEDAVNILARDLSARKLQPTIYESYPPVLEAMLDGGSAGLWFTGQLSVGYNSTIWHPKLDRLSNFTFFLDAGESEVFSASTNEALEHLRIFLANRTPCCPFAEIVFVCAQPLSIQTNEEGRLHSTDGPAIEYKDGYCLYSVNGVSVNEKTAVSPETLTVEEIDGEINLEVRRIMMERFGIARYLIDSKADILHEDSYGTLFRKRIAGDEPLMMVRVKNSTPEPDGSFRDYFLRVPPFMQTAKEAVAWTFGIHEDEYEPEQET